jgi:hypothetical protein
MREVTKFLKLLLLTYNHTNGIFDQYFYKGPMRLAIAV